MLAELYMKFSRALLFDFRKSNTVFQPTVFFVAAWLAEDANKDKWTTLELTKGFLVHYEVKSCDK